MSEQLAGRTIDSLRAQAEAVPRGPQPIGEAFNRLVERISHLEEMLNVLYNKIDPVLSPPLPDAAPLDPNRKIEPVLSTQAMSLNTQSERLLLITEKAQRIIERVEL